MAALSQLTQRQLHGHGAVEVDSIVRRQPMEKCANSQAQELCAGLTATAQRFDKRKPAHAEPVALKAAAVPLNCAAGHPADLPTARVRHHPMGCILSMLLLAATFFYLHTFFRVLAARGWNLARAAWFCLESIHRALYDSVLGLRLVRSKVYMPVDNPGGMRRLRRDFHVRVLVPCWLESLAMVQATVTAALDAPLPRGCQVSQRHYSPDSTPLRHVCAKAGIPTLHTALEAGSVQSKAAQDAQCPCVA